MNDLAAFLKARIDEDERSATPGRAALDDLRFELKRGDPYEQHLSSKIEDGLDAQTVAWEARVLREVEAKRGILDQLASDLSYTPPVPVGHRRSWALAMLVAERMAAVYSDHPDYDPAWA